MSNTFPDDYWAKKAMRDRTASTSQPSSQAIAHSKVEPAPKKRKAPKQKPVPPSPRQVLVQVVMTLGNEFDGVEAVQAAISSALRVGVGGDIREVRLFPLANELPSIHVFDSPPPSEPSEHDAVIESYIRSGFQINIFRDGGFSKLPTYSATVSHIGTTNGTVMDAPSYGMLKQKAEARADRRAFLLAQKTAARSAASFDLDQPHAPGTN